MLFSPGTVIAGDLPKQEAATDPAPAATPDPGPATTTSPATPAPVDAAALLAAINQDRDRREAGIRAEQEAATFKTRAEAAEAKLAEFEKAKRNRLLDPASFFKKMGYTDKEMALTAEGLMFSLIPDKAPPDHRAKLVEAQMLRDREAQEEEKKAAEAAAQAKQTQDQAEYSKQMETKYHNFLTEGVAGFKPGDFPASQAWFDKDHAGYARELLETARTLAENAAKAGTKIDLSATAIAPHLEAKYAERAKRFLTFSGTKATEPQTQVQSTPAVQAETKPASQSRKLTEKELINRATAAAFGGR